MSYELDLSKVDFIDISEDEINNLKILGESFDETDKNRKIELKRQIIKENIRIIEENANMELEENEFVEFTFLAKATYLNTYINIFGSSDNMVAPMILGKFDVGEKFKVFVTHKKIMFYELDNMFSIKRSYIVNCTDVLKIKSVSKNDSIKFTFRCEKDKYNNFRESNNLFLHIYMYKKIHLEVFSADRAIIKTYFEDKFSNL
ncbi:hypothetical protein [Clostridium gasigenes]|uniref:Uncharacterized protein n=1 Tax=Clostridium gasigenes TaxID=94869 RepID=A0A7X0VRX8_9CLOT|nr:hypothetical protein [Clostridium gasigenes]MBB6715859.1 hypothetical protein [Clostridium gasigenes]